MAKKQSVRDLSADELRWLLVEKRRSARQERIDRFRRTGRAVRLTADVENTTSESWRTTNLDEWGELAPVPRSRSRKLLDGFLLIIEVSAVIGFIYILFSGLTVVQQLNREVVAVLEQPTLTPTPLIGVVVLPSGHTPPNSPGGAQFNEAEIPAHLRPLVQTFVSLSAPTPGPEAAVRLQLPTINVDAPVVQGDGWEQLKKGVGQNLNGIRPGQEGKMVLSAHNDIFGEIFRDLDQLKVGDEVIVYTNQRAYTYVVTDSLVVAPTQVEVMAQTTDATVTLISCYPYLVDDQRIVVTARLKTSGT